MAERLRFTKRALGAIQPKARPFDVWDDEVRGLALTVRPTGAKTFYYIRKVQGTAIRERIGAFPDIRVKAAREAAIKMNEAVALGRNPARERQRARAEMTLGELWADYLEDHAKPRKRSWKNDRYQYGKHLARWKGRRLNQITRQDVRRLKATIEREGGPVAANRVRALLSSMWSFAQAERGLDLPNPVQGVKRSKEAPRERYLLPDELRRFWSALEAEPPGAAQDVLTLLLLTGQRRDTICGLRWSEVDLADRVLRIPPERMKADREHMIPLTPRTETIIRARQRDAESGAVFVFPSHGPRGYLYDLRATLGRVLRAAKVQGRFTPHDLRRTWATYAREKGRDAGPVLGHAPQDVTGKHYAQATLGPMRETLRLTEAHILGMATAKPSATVVAFPAGEVPS